MRHVGAEPSRPGQPDQGVQVGAVHVHLAARRVHRLADLGYGLLEHAVGGRVGQHDRGDLAAPGLQLGVQVGEVDRAVRAALDHHDPQARQDGAGRVGPVRRLGDQADVPPGVAAGGVVAPDRQQASSPCDPAFGCTDTASYPVISASQRSRSVISSSYPAACPAGPERVQVGELRPGHRLHLRGRVQLHRARAERDHRAVQRDIEVGQAAQVAQHGRLTPVLVEDRMAEEPRAAGHHRQQHRAGLGELARRRGAVLPAASTAATSSSSASVVVSSQAMPTVSASASSRV